MAEPRLRLLAREGRMAALAHLAEEKEPVSMGRIVQVTRLTPEAATHARRDLEMLGLVFTKEIARRGPVKPLKISITEKGRHAIRLLHELEALLTPTE